MTKTKIVCTIGPASKEIHMLKRLIKAGMSVARLNFSHGTQSEHLRSLKAIRSLSEKVAIMLDLMGPRIRIGRIDKGKVFLKKGRQVILTGKNIIGNSKAIPIAPSSVIKDINRDDLIYIADAKIRLKVSSKLKGQIKCVVEEGGELIEHKGVNLPHTKLSFPLLTEKDKQDILWGIRHEVDYLALSFVRRAEDILKVKDILRSRGAKIPVIAKIEKAEAVQNLNEIIKAADGVMVARGDLGIEVSLEKVPTIQKETIELCRKLEKPVIVATQMLESMVSEPMPTRAEVSDVANAIFDGTDAIMLSEETSIGKFPVESVRTMARIAEEADRKSKFLSPDVHEDRSVDIAVAHSACVLASVARAAAIITFTETGSTALRVSKHRPDVPIFGVVTNDKTLRRLSLFAGVHPLKINSFKYIDEMILNAEKAILKNCNLNKNDIVVITAGVPINVPGTTNLIKVHRIGERRTI